MENLKARLLILSAVIGKFLDINAAERSSSSAGSPPLRLLQMRLGDWVLLDVSPCRYDFTSYQTQSRESAFPHILQKV